MTRIEQKIATKLKLTETALGLFAVNGFEQTQISHISKKAGVAHGTFYVHFESKESVLEEALSLFNSELKKKLDICLKNSQNKKPLNLIEDLARIFLSLINEKKNLAKTLASGYGQILPGSWAHEGMNSGAIYGLTEKISSLLADKEVGELVAHSVLSIWARLGLKFALDDCPDFSLYVQTIAKSSIAILKQFVSINTLWKSYTNS